MRIREITLQPFRNFADIRIACEGNRVLIVGRNGRGKSNILEAISYLSIGKSVRGSKDLEAVPHGGQYFDIRAQCHDGRRPCQLRIFYSHQDGKKAFCDETPLPRVSDVLGTFKTVHFSPEDVSLVLRFPAQRRRLLDILISQSSTAYLRELQQYQRVLTQRNHLLRSSKKEAKRPDENALKAWDGQLALLGAKVRAQRLNTLAEMQRLFTAHYSRFAPQGEEATITYKGPRADGEENLREEILQELAEKREREWQQGFTLSGPQRDDLVFLSNGRSAETYASEGQLKTIMIAWKMAEVRFLERLSEKQPVLLLDDVLSELDEVRGRELLGLVDEFEQVFVTTPQELADEVRQRFDEIRLPETG